MSASRPATTTRERELAGAIEQHRGLIARFNSDAQAAEAGAAELDERAETLLATFTGEATELPEGLQDLRVQANLARQTAADLRKRAEAYAAKVDLAAIVAEHDHLHQDRLEAKARREALEEATGLMAEIELRSAWLFANTFSAKATELRLQETVDRLTTLQSRHRLSGVNVGTFVRLPGEAVAAAGQRLRFYGAQIAEPWLPDLEQVPEEWLQLPEELVRPANAVSTSVDQPTGQPVNQQTGNREGEPVPQRRPAEKPYANVQPGPREEDAAGVTGIVTYPDGSSLLMRATAGVPRSTWRSS